MSALKHVAILALRPVVMGACRIVGVAAAETAADAIVSLLRDRLVDQSQRVTAAIQTANQRAWRSLEIALAGESLLSRLDRADDRAFRDQVRQFLDSVATNGSDGRDAALRAEALRELRAARRANFLDRPALEPTDLAERSAAFARHTDPVAMLQAEGEILDQIASDLRSEGHQHLARFLSLRLPGGDSLLALAVRFFFRREVEADPILFQCLAFGQLDQLSSSLEAGLTSLDRALADHSERLESALDELRGLIVATHGQVLDLRAEMSRHGQQLQQLAEAVLAALGTRQMERRALRPGDSLSLSNESELREVRSIVSRYRAISTEERREFPALLNAVGKLQVAAGDFQTAQQDFCDAASVIEDPSARAEVEFNRYLAALELQNWNEALTAIRHAIQWDPVAHAPFPPAKFEAEQILGAGGFGVAFLCRNRHSGAKVVIKSLRLDGLDRSVKDLFREAQILEELDHPAIIRVRDCDFADADVSRPFIVMDYFSGGTLADRVKSHGPIPFDDAIPLAQKIAEGLLAAHERGILHRDVKPANILVRRDNDEWRVKIIDFGLALRQSVIQHTLASMSRSMSASLSNTVSGTLDYAAPEQLGRLPGTPVGPTADVYGFARTLCFALFGNPQPLRRHWASVPERVADLLERCLAESPNERPAGMAAVLDVLGERSKATSQSPSPEPTTSEFWKTTPTTKSAGVMSGHTGPVHSLVVTSDGASIISGGADGTVRVWSITNGQEIQCFEGHQKAVRWIALIATPSGENAVSASEDQSIRVWDLRRNTLAGLFDRQTNHTLAVSPQGDLIATGGVYDGKINLWSPRTGKTVRHLKGHRDWVQALAFSLSGTRLVSIGSDDSIRFWDVASGREIFSAQPAGKPTAISVVGTDLVMTVGENGTLTQWRLPRGQRISILPDIAMNLNCVATDSERRRIGWGCHDGTVIIWDDKASEILRQFAESQSAVSCMALTADGRHVVWGSEDGTIRCRQLPRPLLDRQVDSA